MTADTARGRTTTAAGDVATLKACYNVLTTLRDFPQRYIA